MIYVDGSKQGSHSLNEDAVKGGKFPLGWYVALSDGLGSLPHSQHGARVWCDTVEEVLQEVNSPLEEKYYPSFLSRLQKKWKENLQFPVKDCDATGVLAVVEEQWVHLFQLGDGFLCGCWKFGQFTAGKDSPLQSILLRDEKEDRFLNETECLGNSSGWRWKRLPRHGFCGVVLCSDGVEVQEERFSKALLSQLPYKEEGEEVGMLEEILEQLTGSDDKTIGILLEAPHHCEDLEEFPLVVTDHFGETHHCISLLAQGGQGAVYETKEKNIAVKLQFQNEETSFPCLSLPPHCNATLPIATLVEFQGYVMPLLEDMQSLEQSFKGSAHPYTGGNPFLDSYLDSLGEETQNGKALADIWNGYVKTGGKQRRLIAYQKLATILSSLHCRALVFGDLSPSNVFFSSDMDFSHLWLIDMDNLTYQQHSEKSYFTTHYVAPEVKTGRKSATMYSEDYSFALALFTQLTGTHPFHGAEYQGETSGGVDESMEESIEESILVDFADSKMDDRLDRGELPWILEGEEENENRNSVEHTAIPHHPLLSPELLALFQRTFSQEGKQKEKTRTSALEWAVALAKERDHSLTCPHCQMDFFAEYPEDLSIHCPWCDTSVDFVGIRCYEKRKEIAYVLFAYPQKEMTLSWGMVNGYQLLTENTQRKEEEALVKCVGRENPQGEKSLSLYGLHPTLSMNQVEEIPSFSLGEPRKTRRFLCSQSKTTFGLSLESPFQKNSQKKSYELEVCLSWI